MTADKNKRWVEFLQVKLEDSIRRRDELNDDIVHITEVLINLQVPKASTIVMPERYEISLDGQTNARMEIGK